MALRKMNLSDIPAVLAIQQELGFQNWYEKDFKSEIQNDFTYAVVYESDDLTQSNPEILGYAIFHLMDSDSELLTIATKKQRQGIGRKLLQSGLKQLDFSKGDCCFLEVKVSNTSARIFYEKQGFKAYHTRKNYYSDGEDAILYKKEAGGSFEEISH